MTWKQAHGESTALAATAHDLVRSGAHEQALTQFRAAAEAEQRALDMIDDSKPRTLGITGVSAVALWYKAREFEMAERLALRLLVRPSIAGAATIALRELLQSIWNEKQKKEAGLQFIPGAVLVAIKGGETLRGGAPLDLIVEKVQAVQAMFYRTIEYLRGLPLRTRGAPSPEVQEQCKPWIFQEAPGSYQFSIAIQKPKQIDLFAGSEIQEAEIAERFLRIVAASAADDEAELSKEVSDAGYQTVFLKLARNLSPTDRTTAFNELEVRSPHERHGTALRAEARKRINVALRARRPPKEVLLDDAEVELHGRLRALDLNADWIVIETVNGPEHIAEVPDATDDVLGPMVNKNVVVQAVRRRDKKLIYVDIELEV